MTNLSGVTQKISVSTSPDNGSPLNKLSFANSATACYKVEYTPMAPADFSTKPWLH